MSSASARHGWLNLEGWTPPAPFLKLVDIRGDGVAASVARTRGEAFLLLAVTTSSAITGGESPRRA
jgi:hypothetical protein